MYIDYCILLCQEVDEGPTAIHLGRLVAGVEYRDVWTDTAEILLNQVSTVALLLP